MLARVFDLEFGGRFASWGSTLACLAFCGLLPGGAAFALLRGAPSLRCIAFLHCVSPPFLRGYPPLPSSSRRLAGQSCTLPARQATRRWSSCYCSGASRSRLRTSSASGPSTWPASAALRRPALRFACPSDGGKARRAGAQNPVGSRCFLSQCPSARLLGGLLTTW